jgi:hypothetical protein
MGKDAAFTNDGSAGRRWLGGYTEDVTGIQRVPAYISYY